MDNNTRVSMKIISVLVAILMLMGIFFTMPVFAAEGQPDQTDSAIPQQTVSAPVITRYTVQNEKGQELQQITVGQKCVIIVSIRDTAFNRANQEQAVYDARGNIGNAKITSTGSFAPPSLENIRFTAPQFDESGVSYSVIFDGITYLGGENQLAFDLTYNDLKHPLTNLSVGISQCVAPTPAEVRPSSLVIRNAGYGNGEVLAGTEFDLTAEILATAGNSNVNMVQVSLQLPESLTVVSGSNNYYIGTMAAESSRQLSFRLAAQSAAETGSYNVTVDVAGIAEDGTAVSNSIQLAVPIAQPERFEITNLETAKSLQTGEEGTVSVTFVNKGKGTIYNLSAKIEGDNLDNAGQSQYLGNVNAGTENFVDFSLLSSKPGTVKGKVILTYEDQKGEEKTLEKEFSVEVVASEMTGPDLSNSDDMNPETMEDYRGLPLWGWLLIIFAVVGTAVAAGTILKKRKEQRQILEDDDEDEMD